MITFSSCVCEKIKKNGGCFTRLFWTNCQFCAIIAQIQTHSSCFVKTQAWMWQISQIIFRVKSWKFYLSQKIFYTSVTCDFCDKFHACKRLVQIQFHHTLSLIVGEKTSFGPVCESMRRKLMSKPNPHITKITFSTNKIGSIQHRKQ